MRQYTIEITVAGCNTRCKHCYVGGGPGPIMSYENYEFCLKKLKPVIDRLQGRVSVTPGHEPLSHPRAAELINTTHRMFPESYPGDGFDCPTTGIAITARKDRENVLKVLDALKVEHIMLTLHGNEEHHNEIVCNPNAFESLCQAADFFHQNGFVLECNLMVSKYLISDWEQVLFFLEKHHVDHAHLTIPLYLPTNRLREYQKYRANYEECQSILNKIEGFGLDRESFAKTIEKFRESSIAKLLKDGWDYEQKDLEQPDWSFFHITQNLDFYYGNAGLHTKYLGKISDMTEEELYTAIFSQKPNFDYSAYYNPEKLPQVETLLGNLLPLKTDLVYPDVEGCLYSWLDQCGVNPILL